MNFSGNSKSLAGNISHLHLNWKIVESRSKSTGMLRLQFRRFMTKKSFAKNLCIFDRLFKHIRVICVYERFSIFALSNKYKLIRRRHSSTDFKNVNTRWLNKLRNEKKERRCNWYWTRFTYVTKSIFIHWLLPLCLLLLPAFSLLHVSPWLGQKLRKKLFHFIFFHFDCGSISREVLYGFCLRLWTIRRWINFFRVIFHYSK